MSEFSGDIWHAYIPLPCMVYMLLEATTYSCFKTGISLPCRQKYGSFKPLIKGSGCCLWCKAFGGYLRLSWYKPKTVCDPFSLCNKKIYIVLKSHCDFRNVPFGVTTQQSQGHHSSECCRKCCWCFRCWHSDNVSPSVWPWSLGALHGYSILGVTCSISHNSVTVSHTLPSECELY